MPDDHDKTQPGILADIWTENNGHNGILIRVECDKNDPPQQVRYRLTPECDPVLYQLASYDRLQERALYSDISIRPAANVIVMSAEAVADYGVEAKETFRRFYQAYAFAQPALPNGWHWGVVERYRDAIKVELALVLQWKHPELHTLQWWD